VVTDIQNMSNANLGGVVTPDARGQIIFQGPDGSTATYWLDFGDGGPRWGVRPVDISAMMQAAMAARDATNNTTPGGFTQKSHLPYTANAPTQGLAAALDPLVVPRFASSGARDTAFPSPADGDRVYRTDLHAHQTYRALAGGGRWVTDPALISEIRLTADTATAFFDAIPQEWNNLIIKFKARATGSPSSDTVIQRVGTRYNEDSAANYFAMGAIHGLKTVATTPTYTYEISKDGTGGGAGTTSATYANAVTNYTGYNVTTNHVAICPGSNFSSLFGGGEITIEDYANSTTRKAIKGISGFGDAAGNTGTGYSARSDIQGGWNSNAAITQIRLYPVSATAFAAGSYFALYGWS
jgi:hypothetical protein